MEALRGGSDRWSVTVKWVPRKSEFQGRAIRIDPFADWLFRQRRQEDGKPFIDPRYRKGADPLDPLNLHVLIRLAEGRSAKDLAEFVTDGHRPSDDEVIFAEVTAKKWRSGIKIPAQYTEANAHWRAARYCTARMTPELLDWLVHYPRPQALVEGVTISGPPSPVLLQEIIDRQRGKDDEPGVGANGIVVGLIDDGLCMASERFRGRDGNTRLMASWIQGCLSNKQPGRFEYGREITQAEIDFHLSRMRDNRDDESAFYRDIQLFDAQFEEAVWPEFRATHATHVLDVAAGLDRDSPLADKARRPIVAVQLPEAVVADGSGQSLGSYVLDGLRYIADRVERAADRKDPRPAPVVVNISYGNNAGPHDGKSDIELAMDEVSTIWSTTYPNVPFVIVLPAGNSFQAQGHASLTGASLAKDMPRALTWQIHPDDGTASVVQLWLPLGFPSRDGRCSVQVTTPEGISGVVSTNGVGLVELVDDEGIVLAQAVYCPPQDEQARAMFQICVGPTVDPVVAGLRGKWPAPHGAWRLSVAASELPVEAEIHAWIQRDDLPRRSTIVARQSRFEDENYKEFDDGGFPLDVDDPSAVVQRQGSLNAIATGDKTIVVGASYEHSDMAGRWPTMALYSGGGSGAGPGVDIVAPAEQSVVLGGILGAGTRSSAHVRMNGTSAAAPAAARDIAEHIAGSPGAFGKSDVAALIEPDKPGKPGKPGGLVAPPRDGRKGFGHLKRRAATSDATATPVPKAGPKSVPKTSVPKRGVPKRGAAKA